MPQIDPRNWATGDPLDHAANKRARDKYLETGEQTELGKQLLGKPKPAPAKAADAPTADPAPSVTPAPPTTDGLGR